MLSGKTHAERWDENDWSSWPWYGKLFMLVVLALVWVSEPFHEIMGGLAVFKANHRRNTVDCTSPTTSEEA